MPKFHRDTSDSITYNGEVLCRIVADKSFVCQFKRVNVGEKGGFIGANASLDEKGTCWVLHNAYLAGHASLSGNAIISKHAVVRANARVYENASVCGDSFIDGNAVIMGGAHIFGSACVRDNARVAGQAVVYGDATICGRATVNGHASVCEKAFVGDDSRITESANVRGRAEIGDDARVCGNAVVGGSVKVGKDVTLAHGIWLCDTEINSPHDFFYASYLRGKIMIYRDAHTDRAMFHLQNYNDYDVPHITESMPVAGKAAELSALPIGQRKLEDFILLALLRAGYEQVRGEWE